MDDTVHERYAMMIEPLVTRQDDGSWRAAYPEVDWSVTAESEEAAMAKLRQEAIDRLNAGESDAQPPIDILERHLAHPIPGVSALDRELFLYLRQHRGVAETERAFEEAERRRALGQTYTKADYDREAAEHDHRRG